MGYEFITESRVGIMAYDISIVDIKERREKAVFYPSIKYAQQRLGISFNILKLAAEKKGRAYSPFFEKELAIRYAKKQ
jgi:hypothetical protein